MGENSGSLFGELFCDVVTDETTNLIWDCDLDATAAIYKMFAAVTVQCPPMNLCQFFQLSCCHVNA